jgi:hypothetical protein
VEAPTGPMGRFAGEHFKPQRVALSRNRSVSCPLAQGSTTMPPAGHRSAQLRAPAEGWGAMSRFQKRPSRLRLDQTSKVTNKVCYSFRLETRLANRRREKVTV